MGYIKKLKSNELVGGTDKTTIYPVTSTEAVFEEATNGSESSFKSQKTINKEQQDELDDHEERIQAAEAEDIKSITINGSTKEFRVDDNNNVDLTIYTVDNDPEMPGIASNVEDLRNMVGTSTPVLGTSHKTRIENLENTVGTGGTIDSRIATTRAELQEQIDTKQIQLHVGSGLTLDNNGNLSATLDPAMSKVVTAWPSQANSVKGLIYLKPTSTAGVYEQRVYNDSSYTPLDNVTLNISTDDALNTGSANPLKNSTVAAQIGYFDHTGSNDNDGSSKVKNITATGFTLPATAGGAIKIKMKEPNTYAGTQADPVQLQFNNVTNTKKTLYYNGELVSASNTWEAGETIAVYYNPSANSNAGAYYASNAQGGGGKAENIKYDNSQSGLASNNIQDALDETAGEVTITQNKTISYTQASGRLNLPSGATAYVVPSNDMVTRYIPVVAGNTYQISGNYSGSNVYGRIGFATNVPAGGVAATVIYDILITGGFTKTYKPTSDGYLSISHFNQSGMTPAVFKLIGTPLKGAVKELSDEVDDLDEQLNNESIDYTLVNNLNQTGGTTYVQAQNYQTRYIPVKAGHTYIATFKTTASGTTHYIRLSSSTNIPAPNVASTLLTQLNAANTTAYYEYTAQTDGYLGISYSHSSNYTYNSNFTQLAGKPDLGTSKAELIPVGGAMVTINTVYPADNTPRVIIPRTSYIIYKDKVLHLSDVYSQDITLSLTGLSGVLRVSFDSITRNFSVKSLSSDFGKTEMEVFTIDLTSGNVTLPDNFYRFNGVIGAGKERSTYLANDKIELTGKKLHGYDVVNFGYPILTGAHYIDEGGLAHALGDIAIYGDELFAFYQNGYVNVYNISDIDNVTLSGSFRLQTDIHSNAAQFAPTVLEGETYPLIYVANGIQDGGGDFTTVEQIRKTNGVYTSTLVQKITVTSTPDYKINTIIGDDGYFWAIGNKGTTNNVFYYAKFALPDISNPTVTLNYNSNSIEKWTENKSYSIAPYVQGLCIHQGKAFHVLGNGDMVSKTLNEIHVVDLNTRAPLTDFVLTDFDYTKIQGCDVYKGSLIVSRNFGKGFTMLIFD